MVRKSILKPEGVCCSWKTFHWGVATVFLAIHIIAVFVVVPWLFSWSGVVVMCVGFYMFGMLAINVGYHRLLTHRSFKTSKIFEYTLAVLACPNLEGSAIQWVGTHRVHHKETDNQPDPHSPLVDFLWAHIGWMLWKIPEIDDLKNSRKYVADLLDDPFHRWLNQHMHWLWIWFAHVLLIVGAGALWGYVFNNGEWLRFALSWLVWGVGLRTVIVWHVTWSVNSFTHSFGYKNYKTDNDSRNTWWLALITFGEAWHNNHHADQNSAAHGHRWWEIDLTYLSIRFFEMIGLVWDVKRPTYDRIERRRLH